MENRRDSRYRLSAIGCPLSDVCYPLARTVADIGETVIKLLKEKGIYEDCHTC